MRWLSLEVLGAFLFGAMAVVVGCGSKQPALAKEIAASPDSVPLASGCGGWAVRAQRGSDGRMSLIVTGTGQSQGREVISSPQRLGYFWVPSPAGSKLAINRYEPGGHSTAMIYDPVKATTQEIGQDARTKFAKLYDPPIVGQATSLAYSSDGGRLLVRIAKGEGDSEEGLAVERFYVVDAQSGMAVNRFWKKKDIPQQWWDMHEACPAREAYVREMLYRLAHCDDEEERTAIVGTDLWDVVDKRIDDAYAKRLSRDRTKEAMFVAWRLAKNGNTDALAILAANEFKYPVSSAEWSNVIEVFAAYNYRPAIPALIKNMDAACLNVVDEASAALYVFYPDARKDFKTIDEEQAYFQKRYDQERGTN